MAAEPPRLTVELLERLATHWRKQDAPIVRRLAPGLSDAEIDALTEPLHLRVPSEARVWWKWHNGAHDDFIAMSGGKAFSSLERCVSTATEMRDIAREVPRPYGLSAEEADTMARSVWNWDWLPFSTDGVGGMLVVEAAVDEEHSVSPVLYRANDDGVNAQIVAPTIGGLVQRWIEALEAGAATYDHEQERWTLCPDRLPPGYDDRLL